MSQKNRTELRKKDFLVIKQTKNQNIVKVVTPQTFQIGLDDGEFKSGLVVKGNAQLEDRIVDSSGSPYIKGSGAVTVTEDPFTYSPPTVLTEPPSDEFTIKVYF